MRFLSFCRSCQNFWGTECTHFYARGSVLDRLDLVVGVGEKLEPALGLIEYFRDEDHVGPVGEIGSNSNTTQFDLIIGFVFGSYALIDEYFHGCG